MKFDAFSEISDLFVFQNEALRRYKISDKTSKINAKYVNNYYKGQFIQCYTHMMAVLC